MRSIKNRKFLKLQKSLSREQIKQAKVAWKLFEKNPHYPSLKNRLIESTKKSKNKFYEVTISDNLKACYMIGDAGEYVWTWIGTHQNFDKLF